jgi:hypothetical protein
MYTYIDGNHLARTLAHERTATARREPITLTQPGILMRSIASEVRGVIDAVQHALMVPTESYNFCTAHPAECPSTF